MIPKWIMLNKTKTTIYRLQKKKKQKQRIYYEIQKASTTVLFSTFLYRLTRIT